jgi:hypothetical protein
LIGSLCFASRQAFAKKHGLEGAAVRALEDFVRRQMEHNLAVREVMGVGEDSPTDSFDDLLEEIEGPSRPIPSSRRAQGQDARVSRRSTTSSFSGLEEEEAAPAPPAAEPAAARRARKASSRLDVDDRGGVLAPHTCTHTSRTSPIRAWSCSCPDL